MVPKKKPRNPRRFMDFQESRIDGFIDFAEGQTTMLWDKQIKGLRLRIGKYKATWQFYADTRDQAPAATCLRPWAAMIGARAELSSAAVT